MTKLKLSVCHDLQTLASRYRSNHKSFPLIAAVLNNRQPGLIYTDELSENYFIVHQFGFADLLEGKQSDEFDQSLYQFLIHKNFPQQKIRWYQVPERWINLLKYVNDNSVALVDRTNLKFNNTAPLPVALNQPDIRLQNITNVNFDRINKELPLELAGRFWASKEEFLQNSFGVIAFNGDAPVAACYACAIENSVAEVDVFTKAELRNYGLGKVVASRFINMCLKKHILPNWDCYTNNKASLNLAMALGFKTDDIYKHAIITKEHVTGLI
jgi:hypothetical protein